MPNQSKQNRVTLTDIAFAAGVSTKTVSLALRGHPSVAEATAQHIQEIAIEKGYTPRRERYQSMGIITPYLSHLAYGELISALRSIAMSFDYLTLIGETEGNPEIERRLISEFQHRSVSGLVLISPRLPLTQIDQYAKVLPTVTINTPVNQCSGLSFDSVEIDNTRGAFELVRYLVKVGIRRPVYLAGRLPSASDRHRRTGYTQGLAEAATDLEEDMRERIIEIGVQVAVTWPDFQTGYDRCRDALRTFRDHDAPDAIIAYNDAMAIGSILALTEQGIRIPEEISVVGFDNLSIGQFVSPSLTTVGVQWERLAWEAVQRLRTPDLGDHSVLNHHLVLKPELIIRNSTVEVP